MFFPNIKRVFSDTILEIFGCRISRKTVSFVYSVFRGIIFCRKFPTLPTNTRNFMESFFALEHWFQCLLCKVHTHESYL
jgi:hypothetical protein